MGKLAILALYLGLLVSWFANVCILIGGAVANTLTLGKIVLCAVGIIVPLIAPVTWFFMPA